MKDKQGKQTTAHLLLVVIWGTLSILLLLVVLYVTWQKQQLETRESLFFASDEVSDHVDNFIDGVMQPIYAMPLFGHELNECSPGMVAQLQQMLFNNPQISALVIKNNKKNIICSTLPQDNLLPTPDAPQLTLVGPLQLKSARKPAFILQQQVGGYFINIYLLQEVVEQTLKASAPIAQRVALFDLKQQKIVLQVERDNKTHAWQSSPVTNYISNSSLTTLDNPVIMRMNLNNLDDFQVILVGDPHKINLITWEHEVIAVFILCLLSALIYYYLRSMSNKHFSLHRAMLIAIKNQKFFPVYQPIINKALNQCSGAEVLLRWSADDQEIIMPGYFIEDAEQSGLIVPITIQLIEKAFQQCQHLLHTNTDFHLAFNLSAIHFANEQFFDVFFSLCKKYQIEERQVMLEITERDLLNHDDLEQIKRMNDLRAAGFLLAVDDFGTGHASISYLQHFPFNYLKIDQLFISAIGTGAITEVLNKSIIQMAKNLKLHIIAEGVETAVQIDFLQAHDVSLMQGWYFAPAMPIEQLLDFLNRSNYE